jgi:hypothetical protein
MCALFVAAFVPSSHWRLDFIALLNQTLSFCLLRRASWIDASRWRAENPHCGTGQKATASFKRAIDSGTAIDISFLLRTICFNNPRRTGPFPLRILVHQASNPSGLQSSAAQAAEGEAVQESPS